MTKQEFEDRIGHPSTEEEFNDANDIYMALPDSIDKDEFCQLYKVMEQSTLLPVIATLAHQIKTLTLKNEVLERTANESALELLHLSQMARATALPEDLVDSIDRQARHLVPVTEYFKNKCRLDLPFSKTDRQALFDLLVQ